MKLYTYPENKNAYKALIAAEYVGVKIEVPSFEMGVDNRTPEFMEMNPFCKVPVLATEKGAIFESNAIARYVARLNDVGLFGSTPEEYGIVEQWIDFSSMEIDAPLCSWLYPLIMPEFFPYDKKKETAAIEAVNKNLKIVDQYLEDKTFLVKDQITLADVIFVCNVSNGFTNLFDEKFLKDFPNVTRYYKTVIHQPEFVKVRGEVKFCETPLKFVPPKKADKGASKKEEKQKEKEQDGDTAQEAQGGGEEKPKEKPKTWLDLLPPTQMPLDSFKRLYSNCPAKNFRETFLPKMWNGGPIPNSPTNEEFLGMDKEGYSFWFADYKYNEENTVNFMVMNKVGGFLQRMDFARKFAFGVLGIYKDEGKQIFPIKGVWIFRGPEVPEVVTKESDDMELYILAKVDLDNPDHKKRLEGIICEDAAVDGLELVDTKVFK